MTFFLKVSNLALDFFCCGIFLLWTFFAVEFFCCGLFLLVLIKSWSELTELNWIFLRNYWCTTHESGKKCVIYFFWSKNWHRKQSFYSFKLKPNRLDPVWLNFEDVGRMKNEEENFYCENHFRMKKLLSINQSMVQKRGICLISINRSIDWSIDWLVDWLIDWLIDRLIDWSIDWLIDWLTDWSIDWLIDWTFHVS